MNIYAHTQSTVTNADAAPMYMGSPCLERERHTSNSLRNSYIIIDAGNAKGSVFGSFQSVLQMPELYNL